ncbi:MAG: DUF4837 family protein [Gemmatimonadales bacterium]|nr:MAG: DUF4837 family protein [Gemmatimonadales bacterium]
MAPGETRRVARHPARNYLFQVRPSPFRTCPHPTERTMVPSFPLSRLWRAPSGCLAVVVLLALAGCGDLPQAHGDANAVIVGTGEPLWEEVGEAVETTLQPTIQTITDERRFRVTWQDPSDGQLWGNLRRFRQILLIGTATDPWMERAVDRRTGDEALSPPQLLRARNVWARGQTAWILLLSEDGGAEEVEPLLEELSRRMDEDFRRYARNRMFVSGVDTVLADSLAQNVGFGLILPQVYRYSTQADVFRFRNDNPTPSELIREVGVTWTSPIPDELPGGNDMMEWRLAFADANYPQPQIVDTTATMTHRVREFDGIEIVEFQSAWRAPPGEWPAGGPFITRAIPCPDQDRLYWLDAWLYAPNRDKYEYMIQLETILDTFRCGETPTVPEEALEVDPAELGDPDDFDDEPETD